MSNWLLVTFIKKKEILPMGFECEELRGNSSDLCLSAYLADSNTKCAYIPANQQHPPAPGSNTEIHQGLAVSFQLDETLYMNNSVAKLRCSHLSYCDVL